MNPNIEIDPDALQQVLTWTGYGKVVELQPQQAAVLAKHIGTHPRTHAVAASGLSPQTFGLFPDGPTIGLEWIRRELNPKANEPALNVNRYLFGLSPDGQKCWGFEVTEKDNQADPVPGTVFPHWPHDLEQLWALHFPPSRPVDDPRPLPHADRTERPSTSAEEARTAQWAVVRWTRGGRSHAHPTS